MIVQGGQEATVGSIYLTFRGKVDVARLVVKAGGFVLESI
jgi:hypothetical protein